MVLQGEPQAFPWQSAGQNVWCQADAEARATASVCVILIPCIQTVWLRPTHCYDTEPLRRRGFLSLCKQISPSGFFDAKHGCLLLSNIQAYVYFLNYLKNKQKK